MTEEARGRRAGRSRLKESEELARRLRDYGRAGLRNWEIAEELGVHANTFGTFLRTAPTCRAALDAGRAEAKPASGAAPKRARPRGALAQGEICPTCGQRMGEGQQTIVLTPADIAEARRKLEDLIDRQLGAAAGSDSK